MNTAQLAICVLAALGAWSQLDSADARERRRGSSSEARVEQAHGTLPPGARTIDAGAKGLKGAPEGGTGKHNGGRTQRNADCGNFFGGKIVPQET